LALPLVVCPYRALDVPQYFLGKLDRRQTKLQNFFVCVVYGNAGKLLFGVISETAHFDAAA
jgi:hypothetical protein